MCREDATLFLVQKIQTHPLTERLPMQWSCKSKIEVCTFIVFIGFMKDSRFKSLNFHPIEVIISVFSVSQEYYTGANLYFKLYIWATYNDITTQMF